MNQWNKIESPKIKLCMYSQLIFNKSAKTIQWERIVSSMNCAGILRCPHANESGWNFVSHCTLKLTHLAGVGGVGGNADNCNWTIK